MLTPDTITPDATTYVRTVHLRAVDTERREVSGIAVPWNQPVDIYGLWREQFAPGSIVESDDAIAFYRHSDPIGKITAARDTDEGWEITMSISETSLGDEAYTLVRDGVISSMSIGFEPLEYVVEEDETVTFTRARVREVSLVPFPAYEGAKVTQVRHRITEPQTIPEGNPMPDTLTREDLDSALADFERANDARFATALADRPSDAPLGAQWRSAGEFLRAVASGDEVAAQFYREYTGGVFADGAPVSTWIADAIRLVDKPRRIINAFSRETLPAQGMTLEYVKLKSNSIAVAKQANEGDDLVFGKVELETDSAAVNTYGGYTELSRQAIERSTSPLLNTAMKAMLLAYANATEAAVRALYYAALPAQIAAGNKITLADDATINDWLDAIVDASEIYSDRGFSMEGLQVSKDVFKTLYRLEDSAGNRLMNVFGTGVNQTGSINVKGLTGSLANVAVDLLPAAAPRTASFYDPIALTTFESSGAPIQLQDENIINLTKQFSQYGYLASAIQFPTALLPVQIPA